MEGGRVELQQLQKDLAKERDAQAKLERQEQANQEIIATLHLQHSRTKVSLEQVQTRVRITKFLFAALRSAASVQ